MNDLKLAVATPPTRPASPSPRAPETGGSVHRLLAILLAPETLFALAIAAAGVFLRVRPWAMWRQMGFDEAYYVRYLDQLLQVGLGGYPDIVDAYKLHQLTLVGSVLPPTRFLYIFCAYGWHGVFGGDTLQNFYAVSRLFSVLTLGLAVAGLCAFDVYQILPARGALPAVRTRLVPSADGVENPEVTACPE